MDNTQKRKRVGVFQGFIPTRGPIVQEGFIEIGNILLKSLLVSHLTLKNPLKVQYLHLIGIRGRFLSIITLMENIRRPNPPIFYGEVKSGQETEAWILGMRKYFQVQDYLVNMKERVDIFNLNGKEYI